MEVTYEFQKTKSWWCHILLLKPHVWVRILQENYFSGHLRFKNWRDFLLSKLKSPTEGYFFISWHVGILIILTVKATYGFLLLPDNHQKWKKLLWSWKNILITGWIKYKSAIYIWLVEHLKPWISSKKAKKEEKWVNILIFFQGK